MNANVFGRVLACGFALILLCIAASCLRENASSSSPKNPLERTAERGPVKLTVRAEADAITVGEHLPLIIDVLAEPGVSVRLPHLDGTLGEFEIVHAQRPPDIPDAGKRRWSHRYVLRTFDAGPQEIPAIAITFTDPRQDSTSAAEQELSTPAIAVAVRSLLPADVDPLSFRDIKEAVDVPLPWDFRTWLMWAAAALLPLAAMLIWLRSRSGVHTEAAAPPLPPHVWAMQQLEALAQERLIERGDLQSLHEFYFRLSSIVRQYIERRFGIMAAEQTTDEFLHAARHHPSLNGSHGAALANFLRQADMVKFARFQPPQFESQATFEMAQRFVQETAERLQEAST